MKPGFLQTEISTGPNSDDTAFFANALANPPIPPDATLAHRLNGQVAMPQFIAMQAEVLMLRGDARALDDIERILTVTETSRDLYFNAELHRLAAECHLKFDEHQAAEAALQCAIDTARAQRAKTFELRAATALGRLWVDRHAEASAHALLQSALEGLGNPEETVDVRRARACLTEWAGI
jgi:hypothetical protein